MRIDKLKMPQLVHIYTGKPEASGTVRMQHVTSLYMQDIWGLERTIRDLLTQDALRPYYVGFPEKPRLYYATEPLAYSHRLASGLIILFRGIKLLLHGLKPGRKG